MDIRLEPCQGSFAGPPLVRNVFQRFQWFPTIFFGCFLAPFPERRAAGPRLDLHDFDRRDAGGGGHSGGHPFVRDHLLGHRVSGDGGEERSGGATDHWSPVVVKDGTPGSRWIGYGEITIQEQD